MKTSNNQENRHKYYIKLFLKSELQFYQKVLDRKFHFQHESNTHKYLQYNPDI